MNIQFYGVQIFSVSVRKEQRWRFSSHAQLHQKMSHLIDIWSAIGKSSGFSHPFSMYFFQAKVFFVPKRDYFHYEMLDFYYNIHKLVWLSFQAIKG